MQAWWVYIIEATNGALYTGITTDVERRFTEHQGSTAVAAKKGAKFFRGNAPKAVVFRQQCADRSRASMAEASIKRLTRAQKQALIVTGVF